MLLSLNVFAVFLLCAFTGVQSACCRSNDVSCLACTKKISIEEYCKKAPRTKGCSVMPSLPPPMPIQPDIPKLKVFNQQGHLQWWFKYDTKKNRYVDAKQKYWLMFALPTEMKLFFHGGLEDLSGKCVHMKQGGLAGKGGEWQNDGGMQLCADGRIKRSDGTWPFHKNEVTWKMDGKPLPFSKPHYKYPTDPKQKCADVDYAKGSYEFCCEENYGEGCTATQPTTVVDCSQYSDCSTTGTNSCLKAGGNCMRTSTSGTCPTGTSMCTKFARPSPKPPVREHMDACSVFCRNKHYGCTDSKVGANQMLSCSQACFMRAKLQQTKDQCLSHCNRKGNSGCQLKVAGHTFSMCSRCTDHISTRFGKQCKFGVCSQDACKDGCSVDTHQIRQEFSCFTQGRDIFKCKRLGRRCHWTAATKRCSSSTIAKPTAAPNGPNGRMCCKAMTAACLACAKDMSIHEYCQKAPTTMGCKRTPDYKYPTDPKQKCAGVDYAKGSYEFCCEENYGEGCPAAKHFLKKKEAEINVDEECLGYNSHKRCVAGLICQDPKKPGTNVNSCSPGMCTCQAAPKKNVPTCNEECQHEWKMQRYGDDTAAKMCAKGYHIDCMGCKMCAKGPKTKEAALCKQASFKTCQPFIKQAMAMKSPTHSKKSGDWCYDQAGSNVDKCKALSKKCQWLTNSFKGKTVGKCVLRTAAALATTTTAAAATAATAATADFGHDMTYSVEDEIDSDQRNGDDDDGDDDDDDDDDEKGKRGQRRKDGRHHHGPPGPCRLCMVLLAVVMYLLGLITACIRARFFPNYCLCCCRRSVPVASSHVVVPAMVLTGLVPEVVGISKPKAIPRPPTASTLYRH